MKCVVKNNSSMDMGPLLPLLKSLLPYSREKLGFNHPPSLFFASDTENASKPLGKTAFYDPGAASITIFVDGRHPKDILRSISHELVHHMQHERGDFGTDMDTGEGYAQKNDALRELEREAYESGNMCFRDWEDENKHALQEAKKHFDRKNKKMSAKQKRNDKIESLLMEKWGFKAPEKRMLLEVVAVQREPEEMRDSEKWMEEDPEQAVELPVVDDGGPSEGGFTSVDATVDSTSAETSVAAREAEEAAARLSSAGIEPSTYYEGEPEGVEYEAIKWSDIDAAADETYSNPVDIQSGLDSLGAGIEHGTDESRILSRAIIKGLEGPNSVEVAKILDQVALSAADEMRQFLISGVDENEIQLIVDPVTRLDLSLSYVLNARRDDGSYYISSATDIIALKKGKKTPNITEVETRISEVTKASLIMQDSIMSRYNLQTTSLKGEKDGKVRHREARKSSEAKKRKRENDEREAVLWDQVGSIIDGEEYTEDNYEEDVKKMRDSYLDNYPGEGTTSASSADLLEVPGADWLGPIPTGRIRNWITGVDQDRTLAPPRPEDPYGTKGSAHKMIISSANAALLNIWGRPEYGGRAMIYDAEEKKFRAAEQRDALQVRADITKEFNRLLKIEQREEIKNAVAINNMVADGFKNNRLGSKTGEDLFRLDGRRGAKEVFNEVLSLDGFADVLLPPGLDESSMEVFYELRADFVKKYDAGAFRSIDDIKKWAHWELGQPREGEDGITRDWSGRDVDRDGYTGPYLGQPEFEGMKNAPAETIFDQVSRIGDMRPRHPSYEGSVPKRRTEFGVTGKDKFENETLEDRYKRTGRRQQGFYGMKIRNNDRLIRQATEIVTGKMQKQKAAVAEIPGHPDRQSGAEAKEISPPQTRQPHLPAGGRREDDIREALIRKVVQEALKRRFGE